MIGSEEHVDQEDDQQAGGNKMEIQLELNFKQRLGTRMGTVLVATVIFLAFCCDSALASLTLGAVVLLLLRSPQFVYGFVMTASRDIKAFKRFVALNVYLLSTDRRGLTVARLFQKQARAHPDKPCFVMDDQELTYAQVLELSQKVAGYFHKQGFGKGDCVALLMETRIQYPCLWLGLSQLGVITALINSHLRGDSLLHSIKVANAKAIIMGNEFIETLHALRQTNKILRDLPVYQYSEDYGWTNFLHGAVDLNLALRSQEKLELSTSGSSEEVKSKLLYVYTSGTTGLPKAAVMTNLRFIFMTAGTYYMLNLSKDDVVYNPLPLYHTAGGIVGVGMALLNGSTVVLRKKFSATNFWLDCRRYNCSVAQYIGELCRYLLATTYTADQQQHNLRLMYGNGLRPQIWSQFVRRFGIPNIGEIYGATEGNSNLINISNRVGAIGFVPVYGSSVYPVQVLRCDEKTGELLKDSQGHCIRCKPGEPGLLVGKVDARRATSAFHGYADQGASEKKLLHNVFSNGDVFFNSGDMVVTDILGYFYFKDRTGDTFRWRGENVATQEVEAIITNCIGLEDCVVYGVEIPHVEGKAGMAAIVDPKRKVDMDYLSIVLRGSLPSYARPLFIRLLDEIPRTATFKLKKRELAQEGYDIGQIGDPIYYLNLDGIYRPLSQDQYAALRSGKAGL